MNTIEDKMDPEKTPTSLAYYMIVDGTLLASRYRKADEYAIMQKMLRTLAANGITGVTEIFCDSKAGHCWSITAMNSGSRIADLCELVCFREAQGHNGIVVNTPGNEYELDPNWIEDELNSN